MKNKILAVTNAVLLAVFLMGASCEGERVKDPIPEELLERPRWTKLAGVPQGCGVYRLEDKEKDVTCWIGECESRAGISCWPNWLLEKPVDSLW